VKDEGAGGFTFANAGVAALAGGVLFDLRRRRVSYKFGSAVVPRMQEARLAVGVNNIGDVKPERAPKAFPDNGGDVSTYSPIGRLWYVQLMARF